MITVATCFWQPNRHSAPASRCYTPAWVNRLAAGFARNLSHPHRFVVLTDRHYEGFAPGIVQERLATAEPSWASMIEPFRIEGPLIVVGLDTVVCANLDALADWALSGDRIGLPRSPGKDYACNGIAIVPKGFRRVYEDWDGLANDMDWLRRFPHVFLDDLQPGAVVSYKCDVRPRGLNGAKIVYFHGSPKPHELAGVDWVRDHWR